MTPNLPIILPQIILAAGGILAYGAGAFLPRKRGLPFTIAMLTVAAALLAALPGVRAAGEFAGLVDISPFSRFYTILLALITLIALLFLHPYARRRNFDHEVLYGTLLFGALGMVVLAAASNWLGFFLGFELLSISLYILIAIRREKEISYEAGIKYFIMGAVASSFLVFGIGLLYAGSGTLAIAASLRSMNSAGAAPLALAGLGLILVGTGFKLSLVPFHLWAPDVYEGAPAPITAFLATGTKIALFAFLLRLTRGQAINEFLWPVLWALAALTMIAGNLTALAQQRVKRLLAYSSVAHMGYLLMALLAGGDHGLAAVMFYSVVYGLMDLAVFAALGLMSPEDEDLNLLEECRGLGYRHPLAAGLLALGLLALAGLPPTGGLVGKFLLFTAAFRAGFTGLAMIGIVTSIVSIYFYLKVITALYLQAPEAPEPRPLPGGPAGSGKLAALLLILGLLWLGLLPQGLLEAIDRVIVAL